jgi:hypothetical protein
MTKYIEKIVDLQTGEETLREYTAAETKAQDELIAKNLDEVTKAELATAKVEEAKAVALAKLEALGLTTDDLKALGL